MNFKIFCCSHRNTPTTYPTNKEVVRVDTVTTTWQESLANLISSLPEDQRQRAHDFFVGYIAAMQEEVKKHEDHQV